MKDIPVEPDFQNGQMIQYLLLHFFANVAQMSDVESALEAAGFGRPHHRILFITARTPGMTVNELMQIMHVSHQNLRLPMKKLLSEGYIRTKDDEQDRRKKLIYVTPKGREFSEKMINLHKTRFEKAIALFGSQAFGEFLKIHEALLDPADAEWMKRITH